MVSITSRIFLIIKHKVDELRDLNAMNGDLGLVRRCDDQALLLGPFQSRTPRGSAVNATAGEVSTVRSVCTSMAEVAPPHGGSPRGDTRR